MTDLSDPLATLRISPARRVFSALIQATLGIVLIATAAQLPEPTPMGLAALVGFGIAALWLAWRMYQATGRNIVLTRDGVYDSAGQTIAQLDQIASVDRGIFAFKPSNGFLIRLKEPGTRIWMPGLWWRYGTRVGVGGATNGKAARDMADVITLLLMDPKAGLLDTPES